MILNKDIQNQLINYLESKKNYNIDELLLYAVLKPELFNVIILNEGCLKHGDILIISNDPKKYNFVIREWYINEWSSGETLRRYKTMPKKYINMFYKLLKGENIKSWPDSYIADGNFVFSCLCMANRGRDENIKAILKPISNYLY